MEVLYHIKIKDQTATLMETKIDLKELYHIKIKDQTATLHKVYSR